MCGDGGRYEGGGRVIVGHAEWTGSQVGMRSRMLFSQVLRFQVCRRIDAILGDASAEVLPVPHLEIVKDEYQYHSVWTTGELAVILLVRRPLGRAFILEILGLEGPWPHANPSAQAHPQLGLL